MAQAVECVQAAAAEMNAAFEAAAAGARETEQAGHEAFAARAAEMDAAAERARAQYELRAAQEKLLVSTGQITAQQRLADQKKALDEEYGAEKSALERKLQLLRLDPTLNPVELERAKEAIQKVEEKYQLASVKLAEEGARQDAKAITAAWESVSRTFNSALNGWLAGHERFGRAVQKLWTGLVMDVIGQIEKMAEKWILQHVIMAAASKAFHAQDTAAESAAVAAKVATASAANVAQATSDAAVAASGTFAFYSAIFPPMAPAMAAAAYAEGMAFAGMAAFDQGGVVPRTGVAMLHKDEVVIDSPLRQMLLDLSESGERRGGNTFAPTLNVHGSSDPEKTAKLAHDMMMRSFKRLLRDEGWGKI
ncbi:MAG: hypothetical protein ABSD20_11865 [Terriglobales bacterium]